MRFNFEKFGSIDSGEVELGNLTILCGTNNVGKTYVNYAVYGFLMSLPRLIKYNFSDNLKSEIVRKGYFKIAIADINQQLPNLLQKASENFSDLLDSFFSSPEGTFKESKVSLSLNDINLNHKHGSSEITVGHNDEELFKANISKDKKFLEFHFAANVTANVSLFQMTELLNRALITLTIMKAARPFVITAERTGISLFQKELDLNKNVIIEKLLQSKGSNIDPFEILGETISRYPASIRDNIDTIRDLDSIRKRKSHFFSCQPEEKTQISEIKNLLSSMLCGGFQIANGDSFFSPRKEKGRGKINPLPMYMTSSSVKSLQLLDIYIKHLAQPGDYLIIDEPELNLHPKNQVIIARILARLVNLGINVVMSTHSEFIIKEINHLIMLSKKFKNRKSIMGKYKYSEYEVLSKGKVKVYLATPEHNIINMPVNDFGIKLDLFDDVILNQGEVTDAILFSFED